jgi:hypothetical protein
LELETLVLLGNVDGVLLKGRELGLEVFDVSFFAFAEGPLSRN